MSKKPNTSAALKETKRANDQAQKNFEAQMKALKDTKQEAAEIVIPPVEQDPPPVVQSSADIQAAGRETRLQSRRRYGFNQSISANNPMLGSSTAL